jgi:hypothetical protein|tara:strand:+ start:416 stop:613 length:198 start_codon:yes stop_codon:yes gene_type:complete
MNFELTLNENGNLQFIFDKWDILVNLLGIGFSIALVVVVIVSAIKLGWNFWPYVFVAGALAFLFT